MMVTKWPPSPRQVTTLIGDDLAACCVILTALLDRATDVRATITASPRHGDGRYQLVFADMLSDGVRTAIQPLIVRQWGRYLVRGPAGVQAVVREVAMVSLAQAHAELRGFPSVTLLDRDADPGIADGRLHIVGEQLPRDTTIDLRPPHRPDQAARLSVINEVHALDRPHRLDCPVLVDIGVAEPGSAISSMFRYRARRCSFGGSTSPMTTVRSASGRGSGRANGGWSAFPGRRSRCQVPCAVVQDHMTMWHCWPAISRKRSVTANTCWRFTGSASGSS